MRIGATAESPRTRAQEKWPDARQDVASGGQGDGDDRIQQSTVVESELGGRNQAKAILTSPPQQESRSAKANRILKDWPPALASRASNLGWQLRLNPNQNLPRRRQHHRKPWLLWCEAS